MKPLPWEKIKQKPSLIEKVKLLFEKKMICIDNEEKKIIYFKQLGNKIFIINEIEKP